MWMMVTFSGVPILAYVVDKFLWPNEPPEGFVWCQISDDGPLRCCQLR